MYHSVVQNYNPRPNASGEGSAAAQDHRTVCGRIDGPRRCAQAQLAFRDKVSGRSNSTRSWVTFGVMRPRSPRSRRTRPYPSIVLNVRDRLDFALPVMRANSSSERGAFSAMTRSSSRLPAERTLAKDSQTFGLPGATPLAAGHRQGSGLHLLVAGDADFQGRHRITPLSRNTASTALQKSASNVAASRYSYALSPAGAPV